MNERRSASSSLTIAAHANDANPSASDAHMARMQAAVENSKRLVDAFEGAAMRRVNTFEGTAMRRVASQTALFRVGSGTNLANLVG